MAHSDDPEVIIARRLAAQGYLNNKIHAGSVSRDVSGRVKVEVWERGRVEKIWRWAKEYRVSQDTLYAWASEVQAAIDAAKLITAPPTSRPKRRNPFKLTLANGHDTHEADDPTPQAKRPDEASSWNEARMKLVGAIDRYSRKRR